MHRTLQYTLLFVILILLQVFVFNKIGISLYASPLVYVAFILLLPMEIPGALLLVLALLTGVTMDFFMAMAGINSAATLFMAFCRPAVLNLFVGKEEVRDGGVPNVNRLGRKRFFRYMIPLVVLHHLAFFILEAFSWEYFYLTLIRVVLSALLTIVLVWLTQKLFAVNRQSRAKVEKI